MGDLISDIRRLSSDVWHQTSLIRRLMSDVRHLMFDFLSDFFPIFLPMYLSDAFVIFDVLPSICTFYHVLPRCFCHVLLLYRVMSWIFVYYHVNVSPFFRHIAFFTTFYPPRNGYKASLCCVAFFCPIFCPTFCIQLFRERLSEKMCTRQSRKVAWDIINTLFLTQYPSHLLLLLSFSTRKHASMASRAILSNFFEQQWIKNHSQYLSELSRALSRNSCILICPIYLSDFLLNFLSDFWFDIFVRLFCPTFRPTFCSSFCPTLPTYLFDFFCPAFCSVHLFDFLSKIFFRFFVGFFCPICLSDFLCDVFVRFCVRYFCPILCSMSCQASVRNTNVLPRCFFYVLRLYHVISLIFVYYHVHVSPCFTTFYPPRNSYKARLYRFTT